MIETKNFKGQKVKKKKWQYFLFGCIAIILLVGLWIGLTAFNSIKRITADSGDKNLIFSIFKEADKNIIKGKNEGRTNILLLGMGGKNHPGGGLSDTIIILSIDWKDKKTAFLSLPRDFWVNPGNGCGSSKINAVYFCGEQNIKKTGGGLKLMNQTVEKIAGVPIHYNVIIDFDGFKKLIDRVGGADVVVEKDLYDPFYPAPNMIDYEPFRIKKGPQHLDGKTALKYVRSRETTSDFDRSRRQQQVLSDLKEKLFSVETLINPIKITDILNILGDHLHTNFSLAEIKSLSEEIKSVDTKDMISRVFDTSPSGPLISTQDERGYIIMPRKGLNNYTEIQEIVQNIFIPQSVIDQNKAISNLNNKSVDNNSTKNTSNKVTNLPRIEVLNGTEEAGVATKVKNTLLKKGYNVAKTGDAIKTYEKSIIYNCSGNEVDTTSAEIKEVLEIDSTVKMKTTCQDIDIQVIIGQDSSIVKQP